VAAPASQDPNAPSSRGFPQASWTAARRPGRANLHGAAGRERPAMIPPCLACTPVAVQPGPRHYLAIDRPAPAPLRRPCPSLCTCPSLCPGTSLSLLRSSLFGPPARPPAPPPRPPPRGANACGRASGRAPEAGALKAPLPRVAIPLAGAPARAPAHRAPPFLRDRNHLWPRPLLNRLGIAMRSGRTKGPRLPLCAIHYY
jgi:hypothetical protein